MPAAYYELSVEQGSDFVSAFRILGPSGNLFRFIPKTNFPYWSNVNVLNIDVPEEIKLAYPDNNSSFGWLRNATSTNADFLTIRSKIKTSAGTVVMEGSSSYKGNSSATKTQGTGSLLFDFITNNNDYNVLLKISNTATSNNALTGKYLYDIELEYKLGPASSTTSTSAFVIRLLQGKVTFNPNITA